VLARHAGRGLTAIGVHTPEFDHERAGDRVRAEAKRHGLEFPQLVDNDQAYWRALGNEYWPTLYLVDRCGRIRMRQVGEVHEGQASGRRLESAIQELLNEDATCGDAR
jgi:hypothetical protein